VGARPVSALPVLVDSLAHYPPSRYNTGLKYWAAARVSGGTPTPARGDYVGRHVESAVRTIYDDTCPPRTRRRAPNVSDIANGPA